MVIRKQSVSNRWHQDYKNHNVYRSNPTSVSFDFPDHETCKKKTQQTPYFELKEKNIKNLKKQTLITRLILSYLTKMIVIRFAVV